MRNTLKRPTKWLVFSFCLFKSKPGADTGFQEGNSGLCGVRPACAAGSRQGTRPLDPDYRLRAGLVR